MYKNKLYQMKKRKHGRRYQGKAWINFSGSSRIYSLSNVVIVAFLSSF